VHSLAEGLDLVGKGGEHAHIAVEIASRATSWRGSTKRTEVSVQGTPGCSNGDSPGRLLLTSSLTESREALEQPHGRLEGEPRGFRVIRGTAV